MFYNPTKLLPGNRAHGERQISPRSTRTTKLGRHQQILELTIATSPTFLFRFHPQAEPANLSIYSMSTIANHPMLCHHFTRRPLCHILNTNPYSKLNSYHIKDGTTVHALTPSWRLCASKLKKIILVETIVAVPGATYHCCLRYDRWEAVGARALTLCRSN